MASCHRRRKVFYIGGAKVKITGGQGGGSGKLLDFLLAENPDTKKNNEFVISVLQSMNTWIEPGRIWTLRKHFLPIGHIQSAFYQLLVTSISC